MAFSSATHKNKFKFTFQDGKTMTEISEYDAGDFPTNVFSGCTHTPDGKRIFISDTALVRELTLSTAWDLTTVTDDTRVSSTLPSVISDMSSENGLDWYFTLQTNDKITHHLATTPWDITTISATANEEFTITGIGQPLGCFVTGKYLYTCGTTDFIKLYNISNGVASAQLIDTFTTSFNSQSIVASSDGRTLYITDAGDDILVEVKVPLGFKGFTGASEQATTIDIGTVFGSSSSRGISIDRLTGNRMVFSDVGTDKVHTCRLNS